jgi:hypothetical protein
MTNHYYSSNGVIVSSSIPFKLGKCIALFNFYGAVRVALLPFLKFSLRFLRLGQDERDDGGTWCDRHVSLTRIANVDVFDFD